MAIRRCCGGLAPCAKGGLFYLCVVFSLSKIQAVTVTWNPNPEPNIAGYQVYFGPVNQTATKIDAGLNTSQIIGGLSAGTTYYFYVTAYNTANLESAPSETIYHQEGTPPPISGTAAIFVASDDRSSGLWRGRYGAQGGISPWGYFSVPEFVSVAGRNNFVWRWNPSTHIEEALQKPSGYDRIPLLWYNTNFFELTLTFKDGVRHRTSFYFFDFGNIGRIQNLQLFDSVSGKLLAQTNISNFGRGVYSTWDLSGNIRVRVSRTAGPNCLMSGVLFGGGEVRTPVATVSFLGEDLESGGNWLGVYGDIGHEIANQTSLIPSDVTFNVQGAGAWTWAENTTNPTALQRFNNTGRTASTWYDSLQFSAFLNVANGNSRTVSFYCVDFVNSSRQQKIEFFDGETGLLLDQTTLSEFRSGVWLSYEVSGTVLVRFSRETGPNTVLSGVFFD